MAKIYIVFLGVLWVGLLVGIPILKQPPELHPAPVEQTERADVTLSGIALVRMQKDSKDWELTAQEAELFDKSHRVFLKKILIVMPAHHGNSITLSGTEGTIHLDKNRFSLRGRAEPVFVQWGNDYKIQTASLGGSLESKSLSTRDHVKIWGAGLSVTGTGMSLSSERSEVTIQDVHAEFY